MVMRDLLNKEIKATDEIIYLKAIGGKVYPELGQIESITDGKICFKPYETKRKKWLNGKSVIIKVEQ